MRREADNVGPKAELEHWKKRMAKFNSLMDQIKSTDCKTVTGILIAAKSKIIKVCIEWQGFTLSSCCTVVFLYVFLLWYAGSQYS